MKQFLTFLLYVVTVVPFFSQAQKTPDKCVNGKKEGLWRDIEWFYRWMDSTGRFQITRTQDFAPLPAYSEGLYKEGVKVGFWKTYRSELVLEGDKKVMMKGTLFTMREYADANSCSLYVEYYKNGNVKAIGQFQEIPGDRADTLLISDWRSSGFIDQYKDTVIHTATVTRPFGKWYYFRPDGSAKELDMPIQPHL